MKKYYAVRNGRSIGLFTNYENVKDSVLGYPNADFKGFNTRYEAEKYLGYDTIHHQLEVVEFLPEELYSSNNEQTLIAYVDGSYCKQITEEYYGSGIVLIHPDGKQEHFSIKGKQGIEMNNVAGELSATIYAMNKAKEYCYKNITIYHDYAGISNWINGYWTAKSNYSKRYTEFYKKEIAPYINVQFVKIKSHSKDTFNDLSDYLAKQALIN